MNEKCEYCESELLEGECECPGAEIERLRAELNEAWRELGRITERNRGGATIRLDDWEKLRVIQDGDAFAVVGPDFVDLQRSPSAWVSPVSPCWEVLKSWYGVSSTPIIYIPLFELSNIIYDLNKQARGGR